MKYRCCRFIVVLLIAALLLVRVTPARADTFKTDAVLFSLAVAGAGAAIAITAYYLTHKSPTLVGCTAGDPGALTLESDSDHKKFMLAGNVGDLKAGERVRITGKRVKGSPNFLVEKVRKNYGACSVATP